MRVIWDMLADTVWQRRWAIGLAASIAGGIVFRLIWLPDMEYKGDEAWTFAHVEQFWHAYRLEPVGMMSSAGFPNAGMSLWAFLAISSILPVIDPLALARAVQVSNVAAIFLLAVFVQKGVDRAEREPWLWSIALVSVSPLAVIFSRKIWPPDILPMFTMTMLIGWWYRGRWWGGFLWGLVGAILGQIQLCGFLFAASFFACTLAFARRSVHWPAWLVGSVLGTLPSLPWLLSIGEKLLSIGEKHYGISDGSVLGTPPSLPWLLRIGEKLLSIGEKHYGISGARFYHPFFLWLEMALGIDLHDLLGEDFWPFLAYPRLGVHHTYLAAACLGIIVLIFLIVLFRLGRRFFGNPFRTLQLLFGPRSPTVLSLDAACWAYGLLLTVMPGPVYLHYLVVAFSLPALWLAWLVRAGESSSERAAARSRLLLSGMVLAQAFTTVVFLAYVHEIQFIRGDYGTAYRSQSHQ